MNKLVYSILFVYVFKLNSVQNIKIISTSAKNDNYNNSGTIIPKTFTNINI